MKHRDYRDDEIKRTPRSSPIAHHESRVLIQADLPQRIPPPAAHLPDDGQQFLSMGRAAAFGHPRPRRRSTRRDRPLPLGHVHRSQPALDARRSRCPGRPPAWPTGDRRQAALEGGGHARAPRPARVCPPAPRWFGTPSSRRRRPGPPTEPRTPWDRRASPFRVLVPLPDSADSMVVSDSPVPLIPFSCWV